MGVKSGNMGLKEAGQTGRTALDKRLYQRRKGSLPKRCLYLCIRETSKDAVWLFHSEPLQSIKQFKFTF